MPQTAEELQAAAIAALGRLRSPRVPELLLRGWKAFAPPQRQQVLRVLFSRDKWLSAVLEAMENKHIAPAEIDAVLRQRLLQHRSAEVRRRATKLFADAVNADRQKVIDAYQSVLTLNGDAQRGAEIFRKNCSDLPSTRRRRQRRRAGPGFARRQIAAGAVDRHSRSQPGRRGALRRLHGHHQERSNLHRRPRRRDRQQHHVDRLGRQEKRHSAERY